MTSSSRAGTPSAGTYAGLAAAVAVALFFGVTACDVGGPATGDPPTGEEANDLTVAERIEEWRSLEYLEERLRSAGLFETLNDEEASFTVFATRFGGIDRDALESDPSRASEVLQYHVVSGEELEVENLSDGQTLETVSGGQLTVSTADTSTFVNGARIQSQDIRASNGFVHIIGRTLLENQSLSSRLELEAFTGRIDSAIVEYGGIPSGGSYTVFAPTSGGFGRLELSTLLENDDILKPFVEYHLVPGETLSGDLSDGQTIQTVDGASLEVTVEDDGTTLINGTEILLPDLQTTNGVIHLTGEALLQNQSITNRSILTTNFSTVEEAVREANLASTLDGDGPFTVFAPQNGAFGPVDTETLFGSSSLLESVLKYHVVQGKALRSSDLSDGQTLTTVEGATLNVSVSGGTPTVNGYPINRPDIVAGNGVVHGMGDVFLENQTIATRASLTSTSTSLENLLRESGLFSPLDDPDNTYTVFTPEDGAFAALDGNAVSALTAPRSENLLEKVLGYHVVPDAELRSAELQSGRRLQTMQGSNVRTAAGSGTFQVEGIPISEPDVEATNGVMHTIEEDVLVPPLDVVEQAFMTGRTLLDKALHETGIRQDVKSRNEVTVFAPSNEAINEYLDSTYETTSFDALTDSEKDEVRQNLKYHVVPDEVAAGEIADGDSVKTVEGSFLNFAVEGGTITLEGEATIQAANLQSTSGLVHGIDGVLVAPGNRQ